MTGLPDGVTVLRQLWAVDPGNQSAGAALDGSELIVSGANEFWTVTLDLLIAPAAFPAWNAFLGLRAGRRNTVALSPLEVVQEPRPPRQSGQVIMRDGADPVIMRDGADPVVFRFVDAAEVFADAAALSRILEIAAPGTAALWSVGMIFGIGGRAHRVLSVVRLGDRLTCEIEPNLAAPVARGTRLDETPVANLALTEDLAGRVAASTDPHELVTVSFIERLTV